MMPGKDNKLAMILKALESKQGPKVEIEIEPELMDDEEEVVNEEGKKANSDMAPKPMGGELAEAGPDTEAADMEEMIKAMLAGNSADELNKREPNGLREMALKEMMKNKKV